MQSWPGSVYSGWRATCFLMPLVVLALGTRPESRMRWENFRSHFPTVASLIRQLATAVLSLVADARRAFPRETALSRLEWSLFPLICPICGAIGASFGCALTQEGLPWIADLKICIGLGIRVGLVGTLPMAVVARASSRHVLAVLLVGNSLLVVSTAVGFWLFLSASAAC
jgi:hypothetical protein